MMLLTELLRNHQYNNDGKNIQFQLQPKWLSARRFVRLCGMRAAVIPTTHYILIMWKYFCLNFDIGWLPIHCLLRSTRNDEGIHRNSQFCYFLLVYVDRELVDSLMRIIIIKIIIIVYC